MENMVQHIESLIFVADSPISLKEIKDCLDKIFETNFKEEDLLDQIETLKEKYKLDNTAIEVAEISGGYQFLTKGAYHNTIGTFLKQSTKKKLSKVALETLAIIAYKQPITKPELESIRGVSCDYAVQKLLEKELVSIAGRSDKPGKPLMYATSEKFMNYFGLKSIDDLPKLKDFKMPDNTVGEPAPIEVDVESPIESMPEAKNLVEELADTGAAVDALLAISFGEEE